MRCAQKLSEERGSAVRLYKNNTDFRGHSYGCHENYLLPRSLPWEKLARGIQAFLVTRQIVAGAGKFAIEEEDRFVGPGFQISQRSDFFSELQSVDTMQRRPIVNTRDEPHANPNLFRRFHVILGDANMSPFSTRLKIGTTALVLEALARHPKRPYPVLADPLAALMSISRDPKFRWEVALQDKKCSNALALQREYWQAVTGVVRSERFRQGCASPPIGTLCCGILEADPMRCRDRLDWVAKLATGPRFPGQPKPRRQRSVAAKPGLGISSAGPRARPLLCAGTGGLDPRSAGGSGSAPRHFRAAAHHARLHSGTLHSKICRVGYFRAVGPHYSARHSRPAENLTAGCIHPRRGFGLRQSRRRGQMCRRSSVDCGCDGRLRTVRFNANIGKFYNSSSILVRDSITAYSCE